MDGEGVGIDVEEAVLEVSHLGRGASRSWNEERLGWQAWILSSDFVKQVGERVRGWKRGLENSQRHARRTDGPGQR